MLQATNEQERGQGHRLRRRTRPEGADCPARMANGEEKRDTVADADPDRRLESVDLLTETWRHHADTWAERVQTAEARAAAVAAAAAALGTLVVSQADALSEAETRATIAFALLMAAVAVSLLARVVPRATVGPMLKGLFSRAAVLNDQGSEAGGPARRPPPSDEALFWHRARLLARTPSQKAADEALEQLTRERRSLGASPLEAQDPIVVRLALHDYWRARAESNHRSYNAKARWVTLAAVLVTAALISLALAGFTILGDPAVAGEGP